MLKRIDKKMILLSTTTFLIIWQIASMIYPIVVVPSPRSVILKVFMYLFEKEFYEDLGITLFRGAVAYLIALFLGIAVAFLIRYSEILKKIIYPYLMALQVIPRISWILLAMIWFPLNSTIVIFIITVTIIPIISLNTLDGLYNIDYSLIEMAKVFNVPKVEMVKGIIIPSIAPSIFSGMKVALGTTWKTVVMAELLTVQTGIGARLSYAKAAFATDHIMALTFYIVIVGLIFQGLLTLIKNHFERWKMDA